MANITENLEAVWENIDDFSGLTAGDRYGQNDHTFLRGLINMAEAEDIRRDDINGDVLSSIWKNDFLVFMETFIEIKQLEGDLIVINRGFDCP